MPSAKVSLNGKIIAESDSTVIVEGNHYFPPESVNMDYFVENDRHTVCHWKGVASYYDIDVGSAMKTQNVAWTYKWPFPLAVWLRRYISFYTSAALKVEAVDPNEILRG